MSPLNRIRLLSVDSISMIALFSFTSPTFLWELWQFCPMSNGCPFKVPNFIVRFVPPRSVFCIKNIFVYFVQIVRKTHNTHAFIIKESVHNKILPIFSRKFIFDIYPFNRFLLSQNGKGICPQFCHALFKCYSGLIIRAIMALRFVLFRTHWQPTLPYPFLDLLPVRHRYTSLLQTNSHNTFVVLHPAA